MRLPHPVLSRKVEHGLVLGDGRCVARVACEECDDAGREHEAGPRHERTLVAVGRRVSEAGVARVH